MRVLALLAFSGQIVGAPVAYAASKTWSGGGDGTWSSAADWDNISPPGSTTGTTNSDVATFNSVTPQMNITVDTTYSIGGILFDGSAGAYTIGNTGGNPLLLSNGGSIQLGTTATSFTGGVTETVNAPLVLEPPSGSSSGNYTFANNSQDGMFSLLNFGGNISGGTTSGSETLTLGGINPGANTISGSISNGNAAGNLGVTKTGAGNWTLSGANTYTGATTVNAGTLYLNYSANPTNVVAATSPLVLGGGTLNIVPNSTASTNTTQTFNGVTLTPGSSSAIVANSSAGNSTTLALGAIPQIAYSGSTLDFTLPTNGSITTTTANTAQPTGSQTILGFGMTVGGTTWAVSGSGATPGAITGLTTYATATGGGSVNQDFDAPTGTFNTVTNNWYNSIRFNTPGPSTAAQPGALGIATGGILETANVGNNVVMFTGNGMTSWYNIDMTFIQNNTANSMIINENIYSPSAVTKAGPGTLIFTNPNNSYSGVTTITGGTLQLGNNGVNGADGNLSSSAVINNGNLAFYPVAGGQNVANNISGTGTVVLLGNSLTLSGNNSYTGGTTISNGSLTVTSLANGGVNSNIGASSNAAGNLVLDGGTLNFTGSSSGSTNRSLTMTTGGATLNASGSVALNISGNVVPSGSSGSQTLTLGGTSAPGLQNTLSTAITNGSGSNVTNVAMNGTNTWVLSGASTYTGTTTINSGTLVLSGSNATTSNILNPASALTFNGGTLRLGSTATSAVNQTINSISVSQPSTIAISPNGVNSATLSIGSLTTSGSGAVNFNTSAGTPSTAVIAWNPALTNGLIGSSFTVTDNTGTGFATVIGGDVVRDTAASPGSAILTANNVNNIGSSTNAFTTPASDGTYTANVLQLAYASPYATNSLTIDPGTSGSSNTLDLNGGKMTFTSGNLLMGNAGNFTIANGQVGDDNTPLTIQQTGTGTLTISGTVSNGTGSLTVTGGGTVALSGNNAFSGGLTVANGTVSVATINNQGAAGPLGLSGVTLGSTAATGTLDYSGATAGSTMPVAIAAGGTGKIQVDNPSTTLTLSGQITGSGSLITTGAGTLQLSGNNTFSGGLTVASGTLMTSQINGANTSGPLGNNSAIVLGSAGSIGTLNYTGGSGATNMPIVLASGGTGAINISNVASNVQFTGPISGSGGLLINGPGIVVLNDTNTSTGGIAVSAGTLATLGDGTIGSGGITLTNGATWYSLYGSNTALTVGAGGGTWSPQGDFGFGGTITGGGSLTVNSGDLIPSPSSPTNIGTLTITGSNTRILTGNYNTNGANFIGSTTNVVVTNGASLDIGSTGNITMTNPMSFASGTGFGQRDTNVTVSTANVTFPSAGLMRLQTDDTYSGNTMTINGNWPTLTGNLTIQVGGNNSTGAAILNGGINGPYAFIKTGPNTLVLAGNSTFSGGTTISAGNLQLGNGTVAGTLGSGPVINDSLLTFNSPAAGTTFANVISGTGSLQAIAGTTTLTGGNTYQGSTTVSGSTLVAGFSSATPTNVLPSGTALTLNGASFNLTSSNNAPSSQTIASLSLSSVNTISIAPNGTYPTTLTINSASYSGTGSLNFNTSTGTPSTAIIAWSPALTNGIIGPGFTVTDNTGTGFATVVNGDVVRLTSLNGATMLTASNSDSTTGGLNFTTAPATDGTYSNNNTLTLTSTAPFATSSLAIDMGPSGSSNTLDLGSPTNIMTFATGALVSGNAGNFTITDGQVGDNNAVLTVNQVGTGTLTISGTVSGGTGSLTKTGSGTLQLTGSNSFTGGLTVAAGTLSIPTINNVSTAGPLGSNTNVTLGIAQSVGTLEYTGASATSTMPFTMGSSGGAIQVDNAATQLTLSASLSGGALTKMGPGTLVLSGNNNGISGGVTVAAGTLQTAGDANIGPGGITLANGSTWNASGGSSLPINLGTGGGTWFVHGDFGFNGTITGGTGLTFTGGDLLPYPSSPTNIGTLTIDGTSGFTRVLTFNNTNFIANNTVNVVNGGNLDIGSGGTDNMTNPMTFGSGTSFGERNTAVTVSTANVTFPSTGTMTFQNDDAAPNQTMTINGNWTTLTGPLTITVGYGGGTAGVVLNGGFNGTGSLTKTGPSTLVVAGPSSYNGTTTVNQGVLQAGGVNAFPSTTTLNNTGGTFNLGGYNQTISTLAGTGNITTSNGNATLTVGNGDTTFTYGGSFSDSNSGALSVNKVGAGTLTLTGNSGFSGGITISAGTLTTTGDQQLGNGSLTFNGGTWDAYNNSARPLVTTANGGTWSPNGDFFFTGTITGGGSLTVNSGDLIPQPPTATNIGTLTITGPNTRILTGNYNTNGANFITSTTNVIVTNGANLDIGSINPVTMTNPMSFASGTSFNERDTPVTVSTANVTFPSTGTMTFQHDDSSPSQTMTINGNWTTLTGPLTIAVGYGGGTAGVVINGGFNGTGSLTKTGPSTLVVAGPSSYNGTTTVNQGVLQAGAINALPLTTTLNNTGGTFDLGGFNQTISTLAGTGNITSSNGNATLTVGNGNTTFSYGGNFSDSNSGVLSVTKIGTGTLTLTSGNNFSGGITIAGGTLQTYGDYALGNGPLTFQNGADWNASGGSSHALVLGPGGGTWSPNGDFVFSGTITGGTGLTINQGDLLPEPSAPTNIGLITIDGSSGFTRVLTISNTYFIANNSVNVINGGNLDIGSGGTDVMTNTMNFASGTSFGERNTAVTVTTVAGGGGVTFPSAGTMTFQNDDYLPYQQMTINGNWPTLTGNLAIQTGTFGGGALVLNGSINGPGSLTFTGPNAFVLAGASTYTGSTTINGGYLQTGVVNALPTTTAVISTNGTLNLGGFSQTIGSLTGSGAVTTAGSTGTAVLTVGTDNTSPGTYSGYISDSGSGQTLGISKVGTGTLSLTGNNSFSGGVSISGGTLATTNGALGSNANVVTITNGATWAPTGGSYGQNFVLGTGGGVLNGTNDVGISGTYSGTSLSIIGGDILPNSMTTPSSIGTLNISGPGTRLLMFTNTDFIANNTVINVTNGADLDFGDNNNDAPTNTMTFASGTSLSVRGSNLTLNTSNVTFPSAGSMIFQVDDTGSGTAITINGTWPTLTGNLTIQTGQLTGSHAYGPTYLNAAISGPYGLTKTGPLTLYLGGANTFSGMTTISAGTIQLNNALALQNSVVSMGVTNGLTFNGGNYTIGGLTGSNNEALNNIGTLTLGNNNNTASYSGMLSGGAGLTKVGTGTQTFTGSNTYGGNTTISGGTLALAFGATSTNILPGGTNLAMTGGTLSLTNSGGFANQTVASLAISGAINTINIVPNGANPTQLTISSGSVSTTSPGSVNFNTSAGTPSTAIVAWNAALTNGIIGAAYTMTDYSGTGFATVNGLGDVVRDTSNSPGSAILTATNSNAIGSTTNAFTTPTSDGTYTGNTLQLTYPSPYATNTLTIDPGTAGNSNTLDLNSGKMTFTAGALLMNDAGNFTITNGQVGDDNTPLTIIQSGTGTLTIGGTISSGTGSLTVTGGGTVALTNNNNSFSGGLTVANGTVSVPSVNNANTNGTLGSNSSVTLGSVNYNGTLELSSTSSTSSMPFVLASGGTGTFQVDNSASTLQLNGDIGGSGGLVKTGAGTLLLSTGGAESYTGPTVVSAGTLAISAPNGAFTGIANTSAITINNGGTLEVLGNNGLYGYGGQISSIPVTINAGGTLTLAAGQSSPIGANQLSIIGGTLTGGGNTQWMPQAGLIAGGSPTTSVISVPNLGLDAPGSTFTFTVNPDATNGVDLDLTSAVSLNTNAANIAKLGAGVMKIEGAFPLASTYPVISIEAGTLNVGVLANGGVNSSLGSTSNAASNLIIAGGASLQYTGTTAQSTDRLFTIGNATYGESGAIDASGANNGATMTFSNTNAIAFGDTSAHTLILTGSNSGNNSFAPLVTDNTGLTSLDKTGTGNWLIPNTANTYTGTTTLDAGTLNVASLANGGSISSLGASSNLAGNLVFGGGTLQYTGATPQSTDRLLTIGDANGESATLDSSGTAPITFSNTGSIAFGDTNAHTLTLTGTNTGANTFASLISDNTGATSLVKTGTGTWNVTGSNTFSGGTTINAGTLSIATVAASGSPQPLGTGATVTMGGGTLQYNGGTAILGQNVTLTGGNGTIINSGGGVLTLAGTLTKLDHTLTLQGGVFTVSGQITGTSAVFDSDLVVNTGATVTLTNANNNFYGPTNVYGGGTLINGNTTAGVSNLPANTVLTLGYTDNSSGTYDLNGTSQTIAGLASSGTAGVNNQVINSNGLGSANGAIGTLTTNVASGSYNFAGSVGGTGSADNLNFVMAGSGTQQLSGTNYYTGSTTVTGGTLYITGNSAAIGSTVNVQSGTLQIGNGGTINSASAVTLGNLSSSGLLVLGDGNGAQNQSIASLTTAGTGTSNAAVGGASTISVLTINNTAADLYTGALGGGEVNQNNLALTKSGSGTLTLANATNSYTGPTTINTGILNVSQLNLGGSNSSIGASSSLAGNLVFGGATLQFTGMSAQVTDRLFTIGNSAGESATIDSSGIGTLAFNSGGAVAFGDNSTHTLILTGSNTGANTFNPSIGDNTGATSLVKSGAGMWALTNTNSSYSGTTTINGGTLNVASLANGLTNSSIGAASNLATNLVFGGGSLQYTGSLAQSTDRLFTIGNSSGEAATLDASGSGSGTLSFTNSGAIDFGDASPHTLTLTGTNTGANTLAASLANNGGSTALFKTGTGTWVITGANTYSGGTTVSAGTLIGTTTSLQNNILDNASLVFNQAVVAPAITSGSYAGTITGNGSVTVSTANPTDVVNFTSTSSSYSGITTINTGILNVAQLSPGGMASSIGSSGSAASNLVFGGGTLQFTGSTAQSTDRLFTIGNASGDSATLDASGTSGGTLSFTGTGAIAFGDTNAHTLTLTGSNTGANSLAAAITDNTGATSLVKSGGGSWTLSGTNTYSGNTTVTAGTLIVTGNSSGISTTVNVQNGALQIGSGGSINANSSVTLGNATGNTSGLLVLGDGNGPQNQTIASLNTAGTGTANAVVGGASTVSTLTINSASSISYGGILGGVGANQNNLALIQSGPGTLTLTGNSNSYSGGTTVSAGTLAISNTSGSATGSGAVGITGATLGGTGFISGTVNVNNGATVFPGLSLSASSAATLSTGAVNFNNGSTLLENLNLTGNTNDLLKSSATITITSGATLDLNILNGSLTQASYVLATAGSPIVGTFANVIGLPQGYTLNYNSNGNDIELDKPQTAQAFVPNTVDFGRVAAGVTLTNAALGSLQNSGNQSLAINLSSSAPTGLSISNLSPASGNVAANGSTAVTGTITTSSAAVNENGPSTFTVTNTDHNATPSATSVTASITVVNDRVFTMDANQGLINNNTTYDLGRFQAGTAYYLPSPTFTYSSSGSHATTADVTVQGTNNDPANSIVVNNIVAVPTNVSPITFNGTNNTTSGAGITLYFDSDRYGNLTPIPVGTLSTTLTLNATGEVGVTGQTVTGPSITVTSDAVNLRTINDPASHDFGTLHAGAAINYTTDPFTTSGSHDTTTDVSVGANAYLGILNNTLVPGGTIAGLSVTAPGGMTIFNGSTPSGGTGSPDSDNRVISGNITGSGAISGIFALDVENYNDVNAAYNPVYLNFTATIYSGAGIWTSPTSGVWDFNVPGNWQAAGGVPGLDPNFTTTDSATFGDSSISPGTPITVSLGDNSPSINTLTFTGNGDYTIAQGLDNQDNPGTGMLHLNGGSSPAVINDMGGNNTISTPLVLDSSANISVTSASPLTISGPISASGNSYGLSLSGGGSLILSGASTYAGGTTISAGTLLIGVSSVSTISGITSSAAGTGSVTLGDNTSGAASLLTNGAYTFANAVNAAGTGSLVLGGNTDNNSTFSGPITLNAALTITQPTTATNNALAITGGIIGGTSGVETVTFAGPGAINVSGSPIADNGNNLVAVNVTAGVTTYLANNTYSGLTTVSGGTLNLNDANANANPGAYSIMGNLTQTNGAVNLQQNYQLGPSTAINASGGTLNFGATTQSFAELNINGGTVTLAAGGHVTVNDPLWSNGSMTVSGSMTIAGEALSISGGTNTVTGGGVLTVNDGLSFLGNGSPNLTLNSAATAPGTLVLGSNVSVDSPVTAATITSAGNAATLGQVDLFGGNRTFTVNNNSGAGLTVSAQIIDSVGNAGLTKAGAGVLTLTQANTYGGTTAVQGGTLLVTNTSGSATGSGNVTVDGSGTLGGNGAVSGLVTLGSISGHGTIDPSIAGPITATRVGSMTIGAVGGSVANASDLTIQIGATVTSPVRGVNYDSVLVTSNSAAVTLNDALLELNDAAYTQKIGQVFDIVHFTGGGNPSITGLFINPVTDQTIADQAKFADANGNNYRIWYGTYPGYGSDIVLTAVPEPGTLVLLLLGSLGLAGIIRRQRKNRPAA